MRYLWDQYHVYRDGTGALTKLLMPRMAHHLRAWDVTSAARVDGFAANSNHVAHRIRKYWRREADVVHPPVAVDAFQPVPKPELGEFYLWVGELAPYKMPGLAIEAFKRLGKPLVVLGGPAQTAQRYEGIAENIKVLGHVPFATIKEHMARCKALIYPGEEDFGIVPVEVMASGRPVIAYGRGGALDTVIDGETGLLFHEQSVEGLIEAVERFEENGLDQCDPARLVAHAAQFDEGAFRAGISASLAKLGVERPALRV